MYARGLFLKKSILVTEAFADNGTTWLIPIATVDASTWRLRGIIAFRVSPESHRRVANLRQLTPLDCRIACSGYH